MSRLRGNPSSAARSILPVVSLLIFLCSAESAGASTYSSLTLESNVPVTPAAVELQAGTAGNCSYTIYTNSTSAKVSVNSSANADFNHVLKVVETDSSDWTVRLNAYDNSSLNCLENCTIYIYDGSNSTQIAISNGSYESQTGSWCNLNATDTLYIWIHVETSSAGTSFIYAYLEVLVPSTTTYGQYIVTFEIA